MKTRIAIIGGFLGAGKTTLATKVAGELKKLGRSVAIVTNDQGETLVDTQYTKSMGIDVDEVLRGCFCCRFPDFLRSARTLAAVSRPDIILAEPVGSCTDLLSTVIAPLKALYPNEFDVAPLMIVVDSTRLLSDTMDSEAPRDYLKRHQIEEGEVVVLAKTDLVSTEKMPRLARIIRRINPDARVVQYAAVGGRGLDSIMSVITSEEVSCSRPIEIDYDIYAAAEAELGWYNGTYRFTLTNRTDTHALAVGVLKSIAQSYEADDIAHVKLMFTSQSNAMKISLVYQDVYIDGAKGSRYGEGQSMLIVNARVVSSPERLKEVVRESVASSLSKIGASVQAIDDVSFSPSRPQPTYRMS